MDIQPQPGNRYERQTNQEEINNSIDRMKTAVIVGATILQLWLFTSHSIAFSGNSLLNERLM